MSRTPQAPRHLSADSKKLWRQVVADWGIEDAAHLKVLEVGLMALDRSEKCRKIIDKCGELTLDRFKQAKPNPLLAAERDSRSQFLTAFKALGLDPEAIGD